MKLKTFGFEFVVAAASRDLAARNVVIYLRRLAIIGGSMILVACGSVSSSGYIARLSPPSPDKFNSPVDFANAYTGGKDTISPDGIRSTRTRMCGVPIGAPRNALYLKGVEEICARQGGVFQRPLCVAPSENTVIFVAFTQDTPSSKRLCNSGLEDFDVVATESVSPDHRQEFTAQMYKLGYKTTATIQAEANIKADEQRKRDVAAEEAQKRRNIAAAVEQNRRNIAAEEENHIRNVAAQEARNRLITSGVEFRKSIKVGAKSNCGPIVEIRQSLAKVYHPVEGYGNEHWLEINSIFPEGAGCSFFNGRYQPPG